MIDVLHKQRINREKQILQEQNIQGKTKHTPINKKEQKEERKHVWKFSDLNIHNKKP